MRSSNSGVTLKGYSGAVRAASLFPYRQVGGIKLTPPLKGYSGAFRAANLFIDIDVHLCMHMCLYIEMLKFREITTFSWQVVLKT